MQCIIRKDDKTTGGGTVLAGSSAMKFGGIGVAREGDTVFCPVLAHGRTVIAEGHPVFRDKGARVACHGHRCAGGCTLISSLPAARGT